MPLPLALAERLAQRGLCVPPPSSKPVENERKREVNIKGFIGCPNKSNIYHDCTHWCELNWKSSNLPDSKYMLSLGRLLQKYPLPHTWTEIFDKGLKRYYFWDMETDLVSWLPPRHPKAKPSKSAAKKREKRLKHNIRDESHMYKAENSRDKRRIKSARKSHSHRAISEKRLKYEDKRGRKKTKRNYIDPMDPAAYSDIPIGTWSDGLEIKKAEATDLYPNNKSKKSLL